MTPTTNAQILSAFKATSRRFTTTLDQRHALQLFTWGWLAREGFERQDDRLSELARELNARKEYTGCRCRKCLTAAKHPDVGIGGIFLVCQLCGNKRCPHTNDCDFECTGSNDVGQVGKLRELNARVGAALERGDYEKAAALVPEVQAAVREGWDG